MTSVLNRYQATKSEAEHADREYHSEHAGGARSLLDLPHQHAEVTSIDRHVATSQLTALTQSSKKIDIM